MEPFNVTNIDHNEGPYLRLKKKTKKIKPKRAPPPPPPLPKKEVVEIEPVIAEHVSQCTATSF